METSQHSDTPLEDFLAVLKAKDAPYRGMVAWEQPSRIAQSRHDPHSPHPLAGKWIPIKDLVDTRGLCTTYGLLPFRTHVPAADHPVVAHLRSCGAVIVGKTNTSSYGALPVTESDLLGTAVNPCNPSKISGGSSGGAAAVVAAGTFEIAHGTDAAGSLRIPAACCGVVGWKTTPGLFPHDPSSISEQCGLHTHGFVARDAALLKDVACAYSQKAYQPRRLVILDGRPFGGGRSAFWEESLEQCRMVGEELGFSPEVLMLPEEKAIQDAFQLLWMNLASPPRHIQDEVLEPHLRAWRQHADEQGLLGFHEASATLEKFRRRVEDLSLPGTFFLHPTLGMPVPDIGWREKHPDPISLFTAGVELSPLGAVANLLRRPAVAFPIGERGGHDMPLSATLIGPAWSDGELLRMVVEAAGKGLGHQYTHDVCS